MNTPSESSSSTPSRRQHEESTRRLLAVLRQGGDLRLRKVRRLRAAVRAKRYENDLKLSIALDRMLGDM